MYAYLYFIRLLKFCIEKIICFFDINISKKQKSIIFDTDSYKLCHENMSKTRNGIKIIYDHSYLEARTGSQYDETTFFGLQILLHKLSGVVITTEDIDALEKDANLHMGKGIFDRTTWDYIVAIHGGRLPISIKAVPEGTTVPVGNVLMTVVNTDPKCSAIVGYFETFHTRVWYPSTVATISRNVKKMCVKYQILTCDNMDSLPFMLHDFGSRGVSSSESAAIGGSAHLVNFKGTDTFSAISLIREVYMQNDLSYMPGFSVPATQHSVMTAGGPEGEYKIIENLLDMYPIGILSMVLDSYDIYDAVKYLSTKLKEKVLARNGKVVVRPDSGDPIEVTIRIANILYDNFGGSINSKGYKQLDPKVGIIYGDGLTPKMIEQIFEALMKNGFETTIVCGMGGGLLQKSNRDTQRFAYKCSAVQTEDNIWHDVFKDPVGGGKTSKKGQLKLINDNGEFCTVRINEKPECKNCLREVFRDGKILIPQTFEEIRKIAEI